MPKEDGEETEDFLPGGNGNGKEGIEVVERDTTDESQEKVKWSSQLEFVVSLLGYSLGLGDIWRVPYLVYRNGGGAFLIPYVICLLICGIPLYFLELSLSQFSGKGPWKIWDICPLIRGFGISFAILNWLDASYAIIIRSWIMDYFVNSFSSDLPWTTCGNWWNTNSCYVIGSRQTNYLSDNSSSTLTSINYTDSGGNSSIPSLNPALVSSAEEFWEHKILRRSTGIGDFGTVNSLHVLYVLITLTIVFVGLVKSVKSIGKLMYITAIGPVILIVIIWIRAITLPGSSGGMLYFITPDFQRLVNLEVWIEAAFMAFYTLGPGWGSLMMLGSHNKFRANCLRDAVVMTFCVITYGMMNGLVVFSVLGVMADELNVPVSKVLHSGGFSLAFVAYPQASSFFPVPQVWAAIFFIMLYLPGVDAMVVMIEPVLSIIGELFPRHFQRRRIFFLTGVVGVIFLFSLSETTQAGVYILQLLDWYVPTWSPLMISIVEAVVFAWVYGCDRINRDLLIMLGRPLPPFIRFCVSFLIPVMLTILLCTSFYTYKPPTYDNYVYPESARIIGWLFALLVIGPGLGFCLYTFFQTNGTFTQRLKTLTIPNGQWKPAEQSVMETFEKSEKIKTTLRQKLKFNLTGIGGLPLCEDDIAM